MKAKTCWALEPEIRARMGVFLAFQYPVELPGVRAWQFLKAGIDARRQHHGEEEMSARDFDRLLREKVKQVEIDPDLLKRAVNEGFSGGEKKRNEILQMAVLEPRLALLDETDSGLDIDALRIVSEGVNKLRSPENAVILVTHYQRILNYIQPDHVHVLLDGRIGPYWWPGTRSRVGREGLRLDQRHGRRRRVTGLLPLCYDTSSLSLRTLPV